MTDAMQLKIGVIPYSDSSGHQAVVTVEDTPEGPKLRIEMPWSIPLDRWPELRDAVDDLVELARKRTVGK